MKIRSTVEGICSHQQNVALRPLGPPTYVGCKLSAHQKVLNEDCHGFTIIKEKRMEIYVTLLHS